MRRSLISRTALAPAAVLLVLATGCSGSDTAATPSPSPATTATSGPSPGASSTAAPAYNPCDDLSAAFVGAALGAEVTEDAGTADAPSCSFRPVVEGGPALTVNYLDSELPFDAVWDSMGTTAGTVTDLDIASADDARMVVNATEEAVAVTGFVKTGDLIENVNTVALAPYDEAAAVRATTRILTRLSRTAASR